MGDKKIWGYIGKGRALIPTVKFQKLEGQFESREGTTTTCTDPETRLSQVAMSVKIIQEAVNTVAQAENPSDVRPFPTPRPLNATLSHLLDDCNLVGRQIIVKAPRRTECD